MMTPGPQLPDDTCAAQNWAFCGQVPMQQQTWPAAFATVPHVTPWPLHASSQPAVNTPPPMGEKPPPSPFATAFRHVGPHHAQPPMQQHTWPLAGSVTVPQVTPDPLQTASQPVVKTPPPGP